MDKLTVVQHSNVNVIDSREVAKMTEVRHGDLLEKITGYIGYLTNGKFRSLDFFIPSTYMDSKGETRPRFLITRKGCDMVANKMTGEKGVLFTAAYVTSFEKMETSLKSVDLGASTKSALVEAKLNNSRARVAAMWLKIADAVNLPAYKEICAHYASNALADKEVLPLPATTEKTYTAAQVGKLLGGLSGNKVGRLANAHHLKTPEYGLEVWDKSPNSPKQVATWRYNDKAVEKLREIVLQEKIQERA